MRYDTLIKNLEAIIYNWYEKEDLKIVIQHPFDGLCDNIKPITYGGGVPEECITSWKYYSGDKDYPVGGREEYVRGEEPYSLFNNPLDYTLRCICYNGFGFTISGFTSRFNSL